MVSALATRDDPGAPGDDHHGVHGEGLRRDHAGGARRGGRSLQEHLLPRLPGQEAAAIEAEAELWSAYLTALADRELSGAILSELHQTLAAAAAELDPGWDERFLATRRLVAAEPALLAIVEHYRAGIEKQVIACLAGKLHLDPEDLRLHVLAELATTAWSVSGRHWVRHDGQGGRKALIERLDGAVKAIRPAWTSPRLGSAQCPGVTARRHPWRCPVAADPVPAVSRRVPAAACSSRRPRRPCPARRARTLPGRAGRARPSHAAPPRCA